MNKNIKLTLQFKKRILPFSTDAKVALEGGGRKTGIITAVKDFYGNAHDSKTLEESLAQSERIRTKI